MHETVRSNVIVNLIRTVTMTILSFITFTYVCRALDYTGFLNSNTEINNGFATGN